MFNSVSNSFSSISIKFLCEYECEPTSLFELYIFNITAKQVPGRLREYGPDMYTFYVELIDIGFSKVNDMYRKRLKKFKEIFVSINEINYEKINK